MNTRLLISTLSASAFLAAACSFAVAGETIDPGNFGGVIDNPWLPLTPGTVLTYEGNKDDKPGTLVVTVSNKTKTVAGVGCVVVEELVTLAGVPVDRTSGYYAQDRNGNVWHFGEDVQELNAKGEVTKTEGWHAGLDGAAPGLVMESKPAKGHTLVNPYTNDHSEVVSLAKAVKTPMGPYKNAVMTKEWTPDEPDVLTNKYYVRDIGMVREVAVSGDTEEFLLVNVKH